MCRARYTASSRLLINKKLRTIESLKSKRFEYRNGKPVAVLVSMDENEKIESLKMKFLRFRAEQAKIDINTGNTFDGKDFFDELKLRQ